MKFLKITVVCLSAALLAACAKEMDNYVAETPATEQGIKFVKGDVLFGASLQKAAETDSKTAIASDDRTVSWAEGDGVDIIWSADGKTSAEVDPATSVIAAAVEDAETYYAVYPAGAGGFVADATESGVDTLTVEFPTTVNGDFANANFEAAITSAADKNFAFKNIGALLKIEVSSADVRTIVIRSTDNKSIAGTAYYTFDATGTPMYQRTVSGKQAINVSVNGAGTYYIPVLPAEGWAYGFGIKYLDGDGKVINAAYSSNSVTWNAGKMLRLGNVDSHFHGDYYFKADGTGKGTSWNDAGGPELLRKLLDQGNSNGYVNAWRLMGKNLYLAAGTYDLANPGNPSISLKFSEKVTATILGGYPATASGTDLSGRDIVNNKTVLTVATPGVSGNSRILYANDKCKFGTFTLDGLHFEGLDKASIKGRGGVIYANNTVTGTLVFKDCRFTGNSIANYGLVVSDMSSPGKLRLEGCVFKDNEAVPGSTIGGSCVSNINTATLEIEDCTFEDNWIASKGIGGAVYDAGPMTITGSTVFKGNHMDAASSTYYGGGAIAIVGYTGTTPEVSISGTTRFEGNYCPSRGGAAMLINVANVEISENVVFYGNEARGMHGGALWVLPSSKLTILGNVRFQNNTSSSSGGGIYVNGSEVNISGNVTFDSNTAKSGGGLYSTGAEINLTGGEAATDSIRFLNNVADTLGGGFRTVSNSTVNASKVAFRGNSTTNAASLGGGMQIASGTVNLTDCSFISNSSMQSGALASAGAMTAIRVLFKRNAATLEDNNYGGGAVGNFIAPASNSADKNKMTFTDCDFISNTARGRGGAIHKGSSGELVITGGSFEGNEAAGYGGSAIMNIGSGTVKVNGVLFKDNKATTTATNTWGAIMFKASSAYLYCANCCFTGNTTLSANAYGTAISLTNGAKGGYIFGCTFLKNTTNNDVVDVSIASSVTTKAMPVLVAHCSMAEENCARGAITTTSVRTGDAYLLNNIVLTESGVALGASGKLISGGYNVYSSKHKSLTFSTVATDAIDTYANVWGSTPTLNSNNQLVPVNAATLPTINVADTKTFIQTNAAEFKTWLDEINAWPSASTWIPGAWQAN